MFQCFRRPTIQVMYWLVEISNIAMKNLWGGGRAGVGGSQQSFLRGGCTPRSNPLPFYIPCLTSKVAISCTFY